MTASAGGNKVRKLEYTCAAAVEKGATTLVTSGAAQSNHARLTAAAACRLGLGCCLVLKGEPPPVRGGNLALEALLGARVVWAGNVDDDELGRRVEAVSSELTSNGRRVEVIPFGGSNVRGAHGYIDGGDELKAQIPGLRHVVVAVGSGGTMAGLVAALGPERVLGIRTAARADQARSLRAVIGQQPVRGTQPRLHGSHPAGRDPSAIVPNACVADAHRGCQRRRMSRRCCTGHRRSNSVGSSWSSARRCSIKVT